jgi:glutathione S-transferase
VPSLEHDGKVLAESIDLIKYVDANFEGPSLVPNVRKKKLSPNLFFIFIFFIFMFGGDH